MHAQARGNLFIAAAFVALVGCDRDSKPSEQRAEEAAEQRAEQRGEGVIDQQIAGEIAEERAALANEVGARDAEVKRLEGAPAQTAAEDLNKKGGAYPAQ